MSTRLQQEVWALDRCSGCGVCVAACSKGVLYWNGDQHPLLEEREKALGLSHIKLRTCEVCEKFCELSCPRLVDCTPMEPRTMISVGKCHPERQSERRHPGAAGGRSLGRPD
jgi:ferredoxin